jgi:magnesium chelatase subunit I
MPALTGKFELEYEGELVGAERVAQDLIRDAVGEVFSVYLGSADLRAVSSYFENGGSLKLKDDAPTAELLQQLQRVPGLLEHLPALGIEPSEPPPLRLAGAEFLLEGLWAQKKIGRSDEKGFVATERRAEVEMDLERLERLRRMKKQVN